MSDGFLAMSVAMYPGNVAEAPAGSSCDPVDHAEVLSVDGPSRRLSWDLCEQAPGELIYELRQGNRILTQEEHQGALDALDGVQKSDAKWCANDASALTLDPENEVGTELYANDLFSDCPWDLQDGRTFATNLSGLYGELRGLVPN